MKNLLIIVSLLGLFASSCTNSKEVKLKGYLKNHTETILKLYIGDKVDSLTVNKDGSFETSFPLSKEENIFISSKDFSRGFLLLPGYELNFSQDVADKENGFKYLKNNLLVAANLYLADSDKLGEKLKQNRREFLALNEDAFISKANEIYTKKKNLLDAFAEANDYADSDFVKREQNKIKYEKLNRFISYKSSHKYFTEDKSYLASEKITAALKEGDYNLGELIGLAYYNEFVKGGLAAKSREFLDANSEFKKKKDAYMLAQFECIEKLTHNAQVKEYLAFSILKDRVRWAITSESELVNKFRGIVRKKEYLDPINTKIADWEKLGKGKSAPDFKGKTISGKEVSLSDLKGKYVYVDVWATWCGPCCGEIPYLQKLEKEYHGKNIVFLSVSVDQDVAKWKKKVKDDKLGGIQINVARGNSLSKDYMISGIPRFMLFDMEGKIVSVNAPRPSGKIREVLDHLKAL